MYIEKALDIWVQLKKNGDKNKKYCVYNFDQYILHIYIYIYNIMDYGSNENQHWE